MDLVVACYSVTANFPGNERFGLTSQLQRAAISIPANIAEGRGRQYTPEFLNHLHIAQGSLFELETHILIGLRLGFINEDQSASLLERTAEVGRMLGGLIRTLKEKRAAAKSQ